MDERERETQFVALLTEIQIPLRLYVQSLLPGDAAARDVAQLANATIWKKHAEFQLGTNFKAWAFSIARFEVLNYRKQKARDARLVFSDELEERFAEDLAQEHDDLEKQHEALKVCLAKLRPKDRELLLHRYSSKGNLSEYSQKTGQSLGGLKVTLHRLRSALLNCIQKQTRTLEVNL